MSDRRTFPVKTGFWGPLLWVMLAVDILFIIGFVWRVLQ